MGSLIFGGWHWETGVAVPIIALASIYTIGRRAWGLRSRRPVGAAWKTSAFIIGCAALATALLSSIDAIATDVFTAHMIQHELLMAVAAPLLVLAEPGVAMLWAFPHRVRRSIGAVLSAHVVRRVWHWLTRPVDAFLLHALAIWLWHIPSLFQAALTNESVHAAQHITFFGSGLLYWWSVLHPRRREAFGLSLVSLFGTAVHTAALGALLATTHVVWYPAYGEHATAWGLTAIEDQQLAGLVMWIPAGFVYLVAALVVLRRWMRQSAWSLENDQSSYSVESTI
ncbi:MAG TPA: cytochrome c oxidase assembly protein [Gemmatimonadaceae bacterium]